MKDKLLLALGKLVTVKVTFPSGVRIRITGELKQMNNKIQFFVHPVLAAVFLEFTPEQVDSIEPSSEHIWIALK